MSEAETLQQIRLALGRVHGLRLFRNNTGVLPDKQGRPVRFGLHPGSADLIGWRSVLVTPDMIGQCMALFVAIEVKAEDGRHPVTPEQQAFLNAVRSAGGIAGVARSPEQAAEILSLPVGAS